ncbi:hypothetical protein QR680_002827 [Steinernema hermaphroditum]|uniref:Uncharacterized protein n=1 Tax=Steinernema hermaphroditum TaxID=289476 RepID=A0AA39H482_9BILA|nr:hypothetical protein QR680_002827 [Steinernema hermaphroditum]
MMASHTFFLSARTLSCKSPFKNLRILRQLIHWSMFSPLPAGSIPKAFLQHATLAPLQRLHFFSPFNFFVLLVLSKSYCGALVGFCPMNMDTAYHSVCGSIAFTSNQFFCPRSAETSVASLPTTTSRDSAFLILRTYAPPTQYELCFCLCPIERLNRFKVE